MNHLSLLLPATLMLFASSLVAQEIDGKRVQQGEKFLFDVQSEFSITELHGTADRTIRAEAEGIAELRARRVSSRRIEWSYRTPALRITTINEFGPASSSDTTLRVSTGSFVTDATGKARAGTAAIRRSHVSQIMEELQQGMLKRWIAPATMRKLRPGSSWEEKHADIFTLADIGINLKVNYTVRYTFDGIVDTMGIKAVRVQSSATQMEIQGTRTLPARHELIGDGGHLGVAYYSTIDGVLLTGSSQNEIDLRLPPDAGDGIENAPVVWRLRAEASRR